jgi:hypothetical protein
MTPVRLRAVTLAEIGVALVAAGSAGATVRLGIYSDAGGVPSTLAIDAGVIDATGAAGWRGITISLPLAAGRWWLAAACQGASSTLRAGSIGLDGRLGYTDGPTSAQFTPMGYQQSGVTGALPASVSPTVATALAPRVMVKT